MNALKALESKNKMIAERERKAEQERIEKMTPEEREKYEQEKRERMKRTMHTLSQFYGLYACLNSTPYDFFGK